MRFQSTSWLLLLGTQLVTVASSPCKPGCPRGSCMYNHTCRVLGPEETCCPRKDEWPEHICGPNQACCASGCCQEGWKCGDDGMCGPPYPVTTNPTTIITLTKSDPIPPTIDDNISGTSSGSSHIPYNGTATGWLPGVTEVSSILSNTPITNTPATPIAGTSGRDSIEPTLDETKTGTDVVITMPDGQLTTISADETDVLSTHVPKTDITKSDTQAITIPSSDPNTVITGTDGEVTTISKDTSDEPGTVITGTDTKFPTDTPVDGTGTGTATSVTNPNGDDSTIVTSGGSLPGIESTAPITVPTGQDSTVAVPSEAGTDTGDDTATIATNSEGQTFTAPNPDGTTTGSDPPMTHSDGRTSTIVPPDGTGTDSGDSTDAVTSNSSGQESNIVSTDATASTGTDNQIPSETVPETSATDKATQTGTSLTSNEAKETTGTGETATGADQTTTGGAEITESDPQESTGNETSEQAPESTAFEFTSSGSDSHDSSSVPFDTSAILETASSAEQTSDGQSSDGSQQVTSSRDSFPNSSGIKDEVTTAPESTVDHITSTLPDGQVTTFPKPADSRTTEAPDATETEGGALVIVPITTPVPEPEKSDDGIKIPCDMWFFDLCIAPIGGWSIIAPPGIHPPGPPPSIKLDPTAPIKVDITGSIPWPGFTVDPAGNPTFSSKPDDCTTETAEMCITSTSYGVSVDGTITSTTATNTVSECGTIYGCDVEDEDATRTITSATTATTQASMVTAVIVTWEEWDIDEYTDAQLDDIAEAAQSRLDEKYGQSTDTTSGATTDTTSENTSEAMPTLTGSPDTFPTSEGLSCVSTSTYTECGGAGGREACVEKPTCASWVNTAEVTMTTAEETPICNAGYRTYTASAQTAVPTNGGPLRFYIPAADEFGSDWDFTIDSDDVKEAVETWTVGNDDDDSVESGDGGKDLEIKWKVPDDSAGTYVELQLKESNIGEDEIDFTATGGVIVCMANCRDEATTTTDADGMVCTHYPCHSSNCEQGPAPEPKAACETVEDGLGVAFFYTVTIVANAYSWIDDDGAKLKKEEKGCGAMTDWHHSNINVDSGDGWTARHRFSFTLPLTIKAGCVERAIASAGGPEGIECANKQGDLW